MRVDDADAASPAARLPHRRIAAVAAAALFGIAGFEIALALGAPLGNAAWGGAHAHLGAGLRVGSVVSTLVWIFAALLVLARDGYHVSAISPGLARVGS